MSEPVAFEYQHEETGVIGYIDQWQIDNGFFDNNPRLQLIGPLYRHPPVDRIYKLEQHLDTTVDVLEQTRAELAALREKYNDLIMQVATKHPDETRHETAKRYIHNAEHQDNQPEQAALLQEKGE